MKLKDINQGEEPQIITEDLEYSQEFADKIINESLHGNFVEVDPDDLLAELQGYLDDIDRKEAEGNNG